MSETFPLHNEKIYLAPLQGFTDYVYRRAYYEIFNEIETWFIPYISVKNGAVLKKYEKEIIPQNNTQTNVVPQILVKHPDEVVYLTKILKDFGYTQINLNLGCPYPMVTNRGMGSGLLPFPNKIESILDAFFSRFDLSLSVKLRAGLDASEEIEKIIPVLNRFPLNEVILHPRIARQLYEGEVLTTVFEFTQQNVKHPLVYNGNIFTRDDFRTRKQQFSQTSTWMLGRGVLMNPFLPAEIKGIQYSEKEKKQKLNDFHQRIYETYSAAMDNEGNVLNKMKQFWIYFSFAFPNQRKILKQVKKTRSVKLYLEGVHRIFDEYQSAE
jgi:tRNA-dihydrouridine synthase